MTLPPITKKQFAILLLIYRFRYLDRKQIQTILKHKNHRRIHAWLNNLVEHNCIGSIYSKKIPDNTKPTIYYLGKYGRKILQKHFSEIITTKGEIRPDEQALYQLTKTYKDSQRTEVFRLNCLALVDCYLTLLPYEDNKEYEMTFSSMTECATYSLLKKFDSYLCLQKKRGKKKRYVFVYITNRTPRRFIRYRIAEIIKYLDKEWAFETDLPSPTILLICSNFPIRNYAKKVCESKLAYYGNPEDVIIRLTTLHQFKTEGLEASIWARPKVTDQW